MEGKDPEGTEKKTRWPQLRVPRGVFDDWDDATAQQRARLLVESIKKTGGRHPLPGPSASGALRSGAAGSAPGPRFDPRAVIDRVMDPHGEEKELREWREKQNAK